jgi:hypothetical protein
MKPHNVVNAREISRVTKLLVAVAVEFGMPNASWSICPQLWSNTHERAGEIVKVESISWSVSVHPAPHVCFQGYGTTADGAVADLRAKLAKHMAETNGVAA